MGQRSSWHFALRTGKELAVKLERVDSKHPMLLYEARTCPSDVEISMLEVMVTDSSWFILVHPGSCWGRITILRRWE